MYNLVVSGVGACGSYIYSIKAKKNAIFGWMQELVKYTLYLWKNIYYCQFTESTNCSN